MLTFYVVVKLLSEMLIFKSALHTRNDLGTKLSFLFLLVVSNNGVVIDDEVNCSKTSKFSVPQHWLAHIAEAKVMVLLLMMK